MGMSLLAPAPLLCGFNISGPNSILRAAAAAFVRGITCAPLQLPILVPHVALQLLQRRAPGHSGHPGPPGPQARAGGGSWPVRRAGKPLGGEANASPSSPALIRRLFAQCAVVAAATAARGPRGANMLSAARGASQWLRGTQAGPGSQPAAAAAAAGPRPASAKKCFLRLRDCNRCANSMHRTVPKSSSAGRCTENFKAPGPATRKVNKYKQERKKKAKFQFRGAKPQTLPNLPS